MLVVMAESMVGAGHQDDVKGQFLGFFLLTDILEQSGQLFL